MADPRVATTNRLGTRLSVKTYKADASGDIVYDATQPNGTAVAGRAVMLTGNGLIRLTADASPVLGKLLNMEYDGYCSVAVGGVVDLPSSGTTTVGTKIVGALLTAARGYVRSAVAATLADVAASSGLVLDVANTAAVEVDLDG